MQYDGPQLACDSASVAPPSHRESDLVHKVPPIARVIRSLVPSGRYCDMVALFDGRAPIETIRKWRQGRRAPPQWAIEILRARINALQADANAITSGPGKSAMPLMAWHARNKDQKKKAGD